VTSKVDVSSLLPLGDANALSIENTKARVAAAGGTPVVAGVLRDRSAAPDGDLPAGDQAAGAAGVQNSPLGRP